MQAGLGQIQWRHALQTLGQLLLGLIPALVLGPLILFVMFIGNRFGKYIWGWPLC